MSKILRILVVDDEDLVRRSLARLLRHHDVVEAADGDSALRALSSGYFDGILCDLLMPGMDGLEFHQTLAAQDPAQAARLVFLTGSSGKPTSALGGVRVIDKPIDMETLDALLDHWMT